MAIPPSPSVVVLENDLSIYAPNVDSSVVGIVGFADKGPTNEATLITSQNQLIEVFGRPSSNIPGQGLEGALEILEATNKVYFVRAADASAQAASAYVTLGFCPAVQVSASVENISSVTIDYTVSTYTTTDGFITVTGSVAMTSSTELDSIQDLFLSNFNEIIYDSPIYATKSSDNKLLIASRYASNFSRLQLTSSDPSIKFMYIGASGDAISASLASSVTASGGEIIAPAGVYAPYGAYAHVESKYPGAGYNLSSLRDGSVVGLSLEIESKGVKDNYTVNSNGSQRENFLLQLSPSGESSLEYVLNTNIDLNQSDYISIELLSSGIGSSGTHFIAPDNPADKCSRPLGGTVGGTGLSNIFGLGSDSYPRFLKPVDGVYPLINGDSGYSTTETGATTDFTALIGTDAAKSGMYALNDDSLNISLALVPGIPSQTVQNALITLAETSKNFIAVVSPPQGLDSVQDAVNWMNGKQTRTAAINNSYAAVYWPWVQTFNYYAGADEWYDPAIFAARQYVFTDSVAEPWFAPAGYRRGRLTKPSNTEVILNQGDRDTLYTNNINPVTKDTQAGIVIFGQRTAQRLPTALNSVNVRRLMIYIRKVLLILGKPFQFQPNDEFTWEQVEDAITPFLDDLKARRGIVEGAVKCDATTNTPLRVDRKELWCSVTIKPTLAAETIVFEVNLTNQSATVNG